MKFIVSVLIFLIYSSVLLAQENEVSSARVTSTIDTSHTPELVLIQAFIVNVPVDSVWNAYTTARGMQAWAAAKASIDLRLNGTIKTNYNKEGQIGDAGTITLHIINYVPFRLLTLQAELTENFPAFMKEDEKDLYNVILFESLDKHRTKVTSYGIGYKNNAKYMSLMKFFIQGNEQSYQNLISYLESGNPSVNY